MQLKFFVAFGFVVMLLGLTACGGGGSSNPAPLVGIDVQFLSGTTSTMFVADVPGDGDIVEFKVAYTVAPTGFDAYIDTTCTGGGLALLPEDGNIFEIGEDVLIWAELTSDGNALSSPFLVEDGTKVEFTLTIIAEARGDGFAQLVLEGIGWSMFPGEGDQIIVLPEGEFATMAIFMNYL